MTPHTAPWLLALALLLIAGGTFAIVWFFLSSAAWNDAALDEYEAEVLVVQEPRGDREEEQP